MFENFSSDEIGLFKALAADCLNLIFIVGGFLLIRRARKQQEIFTANGGRFNKSWSFFFRIIMTIGAGLIISWFLPVKFHDFFEYATGFNYQIGLLAKITQPILVLYFLYSLVRASSVVVPIGYYTCAVLLPMGMIYDNFFG